MAALWLRCVVALRVRVLKCVSTDVRGAISELAELGLEVTVKLGCKKIAWAITQQ